MTGTDVLDTRDDPYAQHGRQAGGEGQYLSFKNGEFLYGQNSEELPIGTQLVANMPGLRWGWRCWRDSQVVEDLTEPVAEMRPTERRSNLGDNDPAAWERDNTGKPRDPWALTYILELADQAGEKYLYSTTSKGGIGAVRRMCEEYAREYRQRPDEMPIIELGRDFYNHPQYGKTYFPVFTIVGWTDADDPQIAAPAPSVEGQRVANPTQAARAAAAAPSTTTKSPSSRHTPRF